MVNIFMDVKMYFATLLCTNFLLHYIFLHELFSIHSSGRRNVEPANAEKYTDRSIEFPHKIDHDDLCYKVFAEHGFEWGGDWEHAKD